MAKVGGGTQASASTSSYTGATTVSGGDAGVCHNQHRHLHAQGVGPVEYWLKCGRDSGQQHARWAALIRIARC